MLNEKLKQAHLQAKEKGRHGNRAALAVARKLVAYLLAADRAFLASQGRLQPLEGWNWRVDYNSSSVPCRGSVRSGNWMSGARTRVLGLMSSKLIFNLVVYFRVPRPRPYAVVASALLAALRSSSHCRR